MFRYKSCSSSTNHSTMPRLFSPIGLQVFKTSEKNSLMLTTLRSCINRAESKVHAHSQRGTHPNFIIPFSKARCYSDQAMHELGNSWKRQVCLAKDQDETHISSRLKPLLEGRDGSGDRRWQLCLDGEGIRRSFRFKTFNKTWVYLHVHIPRVIPDSN